MEQNDLRWTGERLVTSLTGDIVWEHLHRYAFAKELASGKDILDIACGEGYGSFLLASHARFVIGMDLSAESILHAKAKYRRTNLRFCVGDCRRIPLRDHSVDFVVSFETLEHISEHEEFLGDIRRVLRPGGIVVISSPDKQNYSDKTGHANPFHSKELHRDEFEALLRRLFIHCSLFMQRVALGSYLAPADPTTSAQCGTYRGNWSRIDFTPGLAASVYSLAVCSDAPLRSLRVGLFEFGHFDGDLFITPLMLERHSAEKMRQKWAELQRGPADLRRAYCDLEQKHNDLERKWLELRKQHAETDRRLTASIAEAENLKDKLDTARAGFSPFRRFEKFVHKQVRSAGKRRAEAAELLFRVAVRLHWTKRLGRLREECKLIQKSRLLDEAWYRNAYPDLVTSGTDLTLHYLLRGATEGYCPNELFDTRWYLERNPDVAAAGMNPLIHYIQAGWKEGRKPNLHFNPRRYLEANPDVADAGMEPLAHYLQTGIRENRPLEPGETVVLGPEPEESSDWPLPEVRLIAFYLPQFHRIPENDAWWGEGFTEWTNARRGKPQFQTHYQPHVPHASLGYYDLTDESVLKRQAQMARRFGIHGFCFHYYWFAGKRLLEMPVERLLHTKSPDFPFCICWANENWTRRWDGKEEEVLVAQRHSPEIDERFIRDLLPLLQDPRYIRINGQPLLIVYRPFLLPEPEVTFQRWRQLCRAEGLGEIFLAGVQGFGFCDPRRLELDAAIQFPPHIPGLRMVPNQSVGAVPQFKGLLFDYQQARRVIQSQNLGEYRLFRGVMPCWDNTPRRLEQATVFLNSNPTNYYRWLRSAVHETCERFQGDERLVFVNAWNEWGEGCHVEPDERYGFAWLNATRRALLPPGVRHAVTDASAELSRRHGEETEVLVIGHDACRAGAQKLLLTLLRQWKRTRPFSFRLILVGNGVLRPQFEAICPTLLLAEYPDAARRKAVLENFLKTRPAIIYSNTVVNGRILEELRWLKCRVVTHVHELQKAIERWAPSDIMKATVRCSDHFIAVSEPVAENLVARHSIARETLSIIHPFIDTNDGDSQGVASVEECRKELGVVEGQVVVFGCGTTDWRKGPDLFVEIAQKARAEMSQIRFFWIGGSTPDEQAALAKQIAAKHLEQHVRFLGERPNPRPYLALGQIFVLSSREDPFPLVALEAASAGLPIICFEGAGGMPAFVAKECGVVVPFEDTAAAAGAVTRLARDSKSGIELGTRGKAKVAQFHSAPVVASRIAELLKEVRQSSGLIKVRQSRVDPLVSVVVPNYNHGRFLAERLASIRKQAVEQTEILLLDDASWDNSLALLEDFAQSEPRARVVRNEENSGSAFKQWRKALNLVRGKYVWIAESDDSASPDLLSTLLDKLEHDPSLALAYSQSRMIDEQGKDLGLPLPWTNDISSDRWQNDYIADGLTEIRRALRIKNTVPNASAVVFRNFDGITELVDDSMTLCADWLFWIRLCSRAGIAYCSRPLNLWRQNSSNARTAPPGVLEWREGRSVVEIAADLVGVAPAEKAEWISAFELKCQQWLGAHRVAPSLLQTSASSRR